MTGKLVRLMGCVALAASVSACAETGLQDAFGAGKYVPDASQVPTNQALTMPPDLQLRPPGAAPAPGAQPAVPQAAAAAPQTEYAAPSAGVPLSIEETQQTAATDPAPPAPQPAPSQYPQDVAANVGQPAPGAQTPAAQGDVYARYGISTVNPDGTQKTQAQLREELRQKQLEMKRAQNPSYGTIFNMGSIWSD